MIPSERAQQTLLRQLVQQNQLSCSFALNQVSPENLAWKLNADTASIGFIYRHIGEITNLLGYFLDKPSSIANTTMGQSDKGQGQDWAASQELLAQGYAMLNTLIDEQADEWWMEETDTPFFGRVTRFRLFSHLLYHTAHHAGQIALTLSRGKDSNALSDELNK